MRVYQVKVKSPMSIVDFDVDANTRAEAEQKTIALYPVFPIVSIRMRLSGEPGRVQMRTRRDLDD